MKISKEKFDELVDWLVSGEKTMDCLECTICSKNNGTNKPCNRLTGIQDETDYMCRERVAWFLKQQYQSAQEHLPTREEALADAHEYVKQCMTNPPVKFEVHTEDGAFVVGSKRFPFGRDVQAGDLCWVSHELERLMDDDCPVRRIVVVKQCNSYPFLTSNGKCWKYARRVRPDEL